MAIKSKTKYLVVIAGPTAAGKTAMAIELAKLYRTVILSADARQFYRELCIGTAKPNAEQLRTVKHYFIDTKSVTELYGAGHFEKDAITLLQNLFRQHQVVFMVGGSGLYIDAVLNGIDEFTEIPSVVRTAVTADYEKKGLEWLQEQVLAADPDYFKTVDINNPQRLMRGLEVFLHTGKPISAFRKKEAVNREFTCIKIMLNVERPELYRRIDARVDEMMAKGLLEEAKQLTALQDVNALKTVGYSELYKYLRNDYDLATAITEIKQHTRNYAKRQITWFRNKDSFTEFISATPQQLIDFIDQHIKHA